MREVSEIQPPRPRLGMACWPDSALHLAMLELGDREPIRSFVTGSCNVCQPDSVTLRAQGIVPLQGHATPARPVKVLSQQARWLLNSGRGPAPSPESGGPSGYTERSGQFAGLRVPKIEDHAVAGRRFPVLSPPLWPPLWAGGFGRGPDCASGLSFTDRKHGSNGGSPCGRCPR